MTEKRRIAYTTKELNPDTWPDFEKLFEKHNGAGGCWCMFYHREHRIPADASVTKEERRARNRKDKETLVGEGRSRGVIVYDGATPVGWCQYGTKQELPRIDNGRNYRKLGLQDEGKKLWRITCFFVDKDYRGRGVAKTALNAALESIRKQGGGTVEAYPVVSKVLLKEPIWMWFGTPGMFAREEFRQVAPLGKSYMLMRKTIR